MDLKTYLKDKTQQTLADLIYEDEVKLIAEGKLKKKHSPGVTQAAIHLWLKDGVPFRRVKQLVRISEGKMTAWELCPEHFDKPVTE